jgi:hypothetical protein
VDRQEQARARRARRALGEALGEVDQTFQPGHVGKMIAWSAKQSFRRHRVAWTVVGGVAVAIVVGAVAWALIADSED